MINSNIKPNYKDRQSKAKFVFERYESLLQESILDVGADQGYLRDHIGDPSMYTGIGFSDKDFIVNIDLEKERIPFEDNSFDMVMCLDVLEHLENIHEVFDELCRISKRHILISLPNPYGDFWYYMKKGLYDKERNLKFYGLPLEREEDRHKWFFSVSEAKQFIQYRAQKNRFSVIDTLIKNNGSNGLNHLSFFRRKIITSIRNRIFRKYLKFEDFYEGTQWYLLQSDLKVSSNSR